ncbi:CTP synthase [Microgenomates group bacterium RIFCSPLOWO2_01_FULL_47_10]|nr:MAG: CTP synthase [Microgenomates group bacterium RIFCSPLOWO2_01_FULL_47_10]
MEGVELSSSIPYIFVSGGVLSGLGKGVATAALGLLLKSRGYKVTIVKCENYLNIDAGLINPIEHGDPFLCEDGTEADMDLGTYEKFLNQNITKNNFITMGQVYQTVINRERNFEYKGEDVEAIPYVTDEIIDRIVAAGVAEQAEIVLVELGGTAGEYQNALYYEASRIMKIARDLTTVHVHVGYLPVPKHIGEPKTKPTQLSVKLLNAMGIQPDFILARSPIRMDQRRRERFALFCNVKAEHIIDAPDVDSVYEVPLIFHEQGFDQKILKVLNLEEKPIDLTEWTAYVEKSQKANRPTIKIGIVGKYFATGDFDLRDSYAALYDALDHAATQAEIRLEVVGINSEKEEGLTGEALKNVDGLIVPIGWGPRGVEGKIKAIQFARENKIPYLGLCYGMQLAVVEYARHVLGWADANTQEVDDKRTHQVIHIIPEQKRNLENRAYGGTMRLGAWECVVKPGTIAWQAYTDGRQFVDEAKGITSERHRHRYEFNEEYLKPLEEAGIVISGRSVKENLVELIELPKEQHPFFVGTQGHPEYKSRPMRPHPLFSAFIQACAKRKQ